MRLLFSTLVFVSSLTVATIACTWSWDKLINGTLYVCTDSVPFDFLRPGDWVHNPINVKRVVVARSMSEPDTIRAGWSITRLWLLWSFLCGGSVLVSGLLAWLQWNIRAPCRSSTSRRDQRAP